MTQCPYTVEKRALNFCLLRVFSISQGGEAQQCAASKDHTAVSKVRGQCIATFSPHNCLDYVWQSCGLPHGLSSLPDLKCQMLHSQNSPRTLQPPV